MSEPKNPTPPAGWYDDGTGTGTMRWWDGTQWTDERSDTPTIGSGVATAVATETAEATSTSPGRKPHVISWVALGLAAIGFVFACIPGALIIGWVLLPISFILSIVAFFLKGMKWPAIVALVASVVGTIVGVVVFLSVVAGAFDDAFSDIPAAGSSESESEAPRPSFADAPEAEEELGNLAFGEAATFENGLSISVSAPAAYAPSEWASGADLPNNLAFTITITNGSDENFDSYAYSTVTSGGQAGSHIFDSENNMSGSPSGVILPGQTITWTEAWSVADPNSIVFQIAPGWDYEEVIFTNTP